MTNSLAKGKKNLDGTPLLSLSLVNRQAVMTTEEVIQMSIQDFSALWAVSCPFYNQNFFFWCGLQCPMGDIMLSHIALTSIA